MITRAIRTKYIQTPFMMIPIMILAFAGVRLTGGASAESLTVQGSGTAPTVTATAQDSSILVEWEPVENAQRYRYRYRQGSQPWSTNIQQETNVPLQTTIEGLQNGALYTIAVGTRVNDRWLNQWTEVTLAPGSGQLLPEVNQRPTIQLGTTLNAFVNEQLQINASVSDDGLPEASTGLTTLWSMEDGPDSVVFSDPAAESVSVLFPQVGLYTLKITANDGELEAVEYIDVTVSEAPAPSEISIVNLPVIDYTVMIGLRATPLNSSSFSKPCLADLNSDGILDSMWSVHKSEPLNVYYGTSAGVFNEASPIALNIQKNDNHGCVVADFDQDGLLDIFGPKGACQGTCFKRDSLWMQNASGSFNTMDWKLGAATRDRSRDSVAADFNNDGWVDLLISASAASTGSHSNHRIMFNNGRDANGVWAGFSTPSNVGIGRSSGNSSCADAADLDGDGWVDALLCNNKTNASTDGLQIYKNNGDGTFSNYPTTIDFIGARGVSTSDINQDGLPDLLVAFVDRFELRLNQGGGVFDTVTMTIPLEFGYEVVTPDFDGDGDLDIFIVQAHSNRDPLADGAHMLLLNRNGLATEWDRVPVPQPNRGAGDKAVVYPNFRGTGADAVLIGNGGQWDTKGPRQVLARQ